jgi:UDP-glucuronate decarboxylase
MDPYDGRVVSNFICQALRNERLTIYGDGKQTRSFCYIDDLIRGVIAVGALHKNPNGPVNLGNSQEFTMLELARLVIDVTKNLYHRDEIGEVIEHQPLPIDDPTQRRPDVTRAKELICWEPRVSLADGLDRTARYFANIMDGHSY